MNIFNRLFKSFKSFSLKRLTAPQSPAAPHFQAFILEPILTPSVGFLIDTQTEHSLGTEINYPLPDHNLDLHQIYPSGTFTVDATGQVSIDYLFDGGAYQGDLAVFSLAGMEQSAPGSAAFIQEAAHRALTDSVLGHLVISDINQGARFSAELGETNWNYGEYLGVKTVAMNPGDTFGVMLVPNGSLQQVLQHIDNNPTIDPFSTDPALCPLFSMVAANPNQAFHVGQIADVTGDGNTFVMEDLRLDLGSDRDYNDIIFQVRGAKGIAVHLDDVINPNLPDWRSTDMGKALLDYVHPYVTAMEPPAPIVLPEVTVDHQPLIGILDPTGFSNHNPDLNYNHIIIGSDRVDSDLNPFVDHSAGDSGTHIAGIISATQNNQIGIDGINDQANIWLGRATNDNWAASLTEFVDSARAAHEPNAVIQLNFDLTQVNHDGSISTRYELNTNELAALSYAHDNHILIVVPAGDDGSTISALGQASHQFDNIITVGSAHHITEDPAVPIAQAYERADYSDYGSALDIVADGGAIAHPITSSVGDGTGTMAGTSVAAAQVTGAASLIWAANPDLDYRQVIDILKSTATDLNVPGWDAQTGAGLLNIAAAVSLAQAVEPDIYLDPAIAPVTIPGYRAYVVQPGDTLTSIAREELNTSDRWTDIILLDGSHFPNSHPSLTPGDTVYLPIDVEIGTGNPLVERPSLIPNQAPLLSLNASQSFYIEGETIRLTGSIAAFDPNGNTDLSQLQLRLHAPDGSAVDLGTITQFTPGSNGLVYANYNFLPNINFVPGIYQLEVIGSDRLGLQTDITSDLAIISPPNFQAPAGLSPNLTYAIQRAANLEGYDSEDLDGINHWLVSLPPSPSDQEIQLDQKIQKIQQIAHSIGATYLVDEKQHLPNTYVFEFPADQSPAEIGVLLNQLPDAQYFYPLVAYELKRPELIMNAPLFPGQWELQNTGQTGGVAGNDINVLNAWDISLPGYPGEDVLGTGIVIGIVDDGVQFSHPDLISNYLSGLSYDFTNVWGESSYQDSLYEFERQVVSAKSSTGIRRLVVSAKPSAGIRRLVVPAKSSGGIRRLVVAAKSSTGIRRLVVAAKSSAGIRRSSDDATTTQDEDIVFVLPAMHGTSVAGVAAASGKSGVLGVAPNADFASLQLISDSVTDQQIADALSYRQDLIQIYNNSWKPVATLAGPPETLFELENGATIGRGGLGNIYVFAAGNDGWEGDNVNYNGFANSRHAIAVAAIDDKGEQTWYSTPGAAVLVSAYSSNSDDAGNSVGITTTDLLGADGFDPTDYTHEFGGTSSAAPVVSGIIALMLAANPNLSQRDVQHILVETARQNDPTDSGWTTNGAGYKVNDKYGFGAVDAAAAVEAAISWKPVSPEVRISSPVVLVNKPIPDYDPALVVDPDHPENAPNNPLFISKPIITITQDITVEWAEVMFDATHSSRGDLKVTLTSPDGTESILAEPHFDEGADYYKWVFTSNRNWGESSLGDWTLRVSDELDGDVGTFNSWQLNLYGTAKPIPNNSWTKQLGTPSEDTSRHIAVDSDGNLYAVGYTLGSLDGNNLGSADAYLAKYDSLGNLQWKRQLGTANSDQAWGVAVDSTKNIYITGNTGFSVNAQGNSLGTNDAFIAKYDSNGNQLWNNLISSPYDDTARDIAVDSVGNAYITGITWGNLAGNSSGQGDTWVAKYDSQGNQVWIEQSGTSGIDFSLGIARDSEGNIYTAGYTDGSFDSNTNAGNTDVFISKYNQNGEKLWTKQLGTTASEGYFDNSYGLGGGLASFERRFGIATDNTGNVYISGLTAGSLDGNINAGGTDAFIAKYDKDGNKLWTQQLGTTGDDRSAAVAVDSNNNVYILGYTTGSLDGQQNLGGADTFVVKYDSNGNKLETKLFGTTADDVGGDIAIDHSDNIYFTGNTFGGLVGSNAGSIDAWIAKNEFIQIPGTPQVTIVAADATASEGGNAGQFVVTRTGDTSQALTVKLAITGDAKNGQDYSSLPGSIVIPVGATSVTIPVIAKADAVVEPDEKVTVILAGGNNYDVGSDSSASVTIQDYTGNSQYGPFTYVNPANGHIYILSQADSWLGAQAQAQALGGNLVTVNNAAEQNWLVNTFGSQGFWIGLTDSEIYNATEGNFKWVNGEPVTYIDWEAGNPSNTLWDAQGEDFVEMNRHNPSGMWNDITNSWWSQPGIIEVDPNQLTKPIVLIQASDNQAGEEGNAGQLVVSRIGDTTNPLTVKYSVAGNATNGTDYEQLSGTITIPAGAALVTIPIVPMVDYQLEGTEKVIVNLTPDSTYTVSAQGTTTVDIADRNPINQISNEVIGRDVTSLAYWRNRLNSGASLSDIRREIIEAAQDGQGNYEFATQVQQIYQNTLGRAANTAEIAYWRGQLENGATLAQIAQILGNIVADSISEFSNVQGQNNWYYGYYEGSLVSDNFQEMTEVKYGDWWVDNADYWTTLNSIGGHPNSVVGGITPVNQFPVRRWVSEVDGNINISGILAKRDTRFSGISDGTIGHILVDGVEVWSQAISATDNVGVNYIINAAVHAGSVVDFVIDAKSNDHYDGTKFTATIATEPLTPQPTTSKIYTNPTTGHKYFLAAPDTWLGAEAQAEAAGGNLVTINDASEQQWLNTTFGGGSRWIGLTDSPMYGATEGNFKWVNGQPVAYKNWWGTDNVLFTPEGEDFAEMGWGAEGKWNDMPSEQAWIRRGIVEIPSTPIVIANLDGLTVSNTNDSGAGSLRDAINQANSNPVLATIKFNIPTTDPNYNPITGGFTIRPNSELPTITDQIIIDGTTQPGYAGKPIIELDGSNAGGFANGLVINASNSTVKGLVINHFNSGYGIWLQSNNNAIVANYIGTDITGSEDSGDRYGIYVEGNNNIIGGNSSEDRNLISGNDVSGVHLKGSGNKVLGNYVGTDISGTKNLRNRYGISPEGDNNIIGGNSPEVRNLISGNDFGIILLGSDNNEIMGNYIGTDITGTQDLGNDYGIYGDGNNNIIGGNSSDTGNLISGNYHGVELRGSSNSILGNYIGTDVTGTQDLGNSRNGLSIYGDNNIIGGTTTEARNLISGNDGEGLSLTGVNNQILGNYFGTDITGTQNLGNTGIGALINGNNNTIGGTTGGARNLMSNNRNGLEISGSNNQVLGNYFGTDVTGTQGLGNLSAGIYITGNNNIVGGANVNAQNLISGNNTDGVNISGNSNQILGNYVGTDITGTQELGNQSTGIAVRGNDNIVGGTNDAGNLVSGNHKGMLVSGKNNQIVGNYIGTDITGTQDIGNNYTGLNVDGNNNIIGGTTLGSRNLISANDHGNEVFEPGFIINGNSNQVLGNYIGTDITGTQDMGNGKIGFYVNGSYNIIGGTEAGSRNLISGNNSEGLVLYGNSNQVLGNYIGTDITGTENLGNGKDGINIDGKNNIIGGTTTAALNLISGNQGSGISVSRNNNQILGNYIGTDITGTQNIGNANSGIVINASNNIIGGTDSGAGNVIAFNGKKGVSIVVYANGNQDAILSNSIFSNQSLGIDLDDNGVTANDLGDGDSGRNDFQNYPVLSSAASDGSSTNIIGTLNSTPNTTFRLEFFSNPDDSRQGKIFLGYENVTTDSNGDASFDVTFATAVATGSYITSTATDSNNNTSEFSTGVASNFIPLGQTPGRPSGR